MKNHPMKRKSEQFCFLSSFPPFLHFPDNHSLFTPRHHFFSLPLLDAVEPLSPMIFYRRTDVAPSTFSPVEKQPDFPLISA